MEGHRTILSRLAAWIKGASTEIRYSPEVDRGTCVRVEHVFAMIACIVIPGFELRVALQRRPRLRLEPAALAPEPGAEALLGPVTAAAEAAGVEPGMRLGEALATCPSLQLVDPDPAAAEEAWEGIVKRLEDAGIAVDPAAPGCAYFETSGVERLGRQTI